MNCTILFASDLRRDRETCLWLAQKLTKPDSYFNRRLLGYVTGESATPEHGDIAVVRDRGEIVGWCRSETWTDEDGDSSDTLEAFVASEYRGRGVAAFAAAGLVAGTLLFDRSCGNVAVFAPSMLLLARRVGLRPTLYEKDADGVWCQA